VLGRCTDSVRLPLVLLEEKTKAAVRDAMVHAGSHQLAAGFEVETAAEANRRLQHCVGYNLSEFGEN
jgi:hypothetical protein